MQFPHALKRSFFLLIISCVVSTTSYAQLSGVVSDTEGNTLPFVNVYVADTNIGTTTNGDGVYKLEIPKSIEVVTVVYQFLGYTTVRKEIEVGDLPSELTIQLEEETTSLNEVVIQSGVNPADRIVRATIDRRKENLDKLGAFKAKFYSRGLWKVKDAPEKILGQEVGDLGGGLDSTRTGIIYLSETISNIAYQRPDNFSEVIVASKVSGNDNGFSFNTASDANFSFYENTLDLNAQIISPIASNAFAYYTYTLEGTFYEEGSLINKILVTPRRPQDRVFNGYIYIVEDDWQIYGVDLNTNGQAIQVPMVEALSFKQNFKKEPTLNLWVKTSQVIDFSFGFLGFKGDGRFTAGYSEYEFEPAFTKDSFSSEILSFAPAANEKDSLYWKRARPVPLTALEVEDYIRKDSVQVIRKSRKYLDSIDARGNKFKLTSPIFGYTYTNTFKRWNASFSGPLRDIQFNTVQGWNGELEARYFKWSDDDYTRTFSAFARANYGFSDDRLRYTLGLTRRFNRTNRAFLSVNGGVTLQQFNPEEPITPTINTITTLAFERNYAKFYEKAFAQASYSQEVVNGLRLSGTLNYERRTPVFNTTDQTFYPKRDIQFTSNNPLLPEADGVAAIPEHELARAIISGRVNFGQKYYSYPSGKFNVTTDKYPTLLVSYEKGFAGSEENFNFDQLRLGLWQGFNVGNKGRLEYNAKVGTFLGTGEGISFVDFQHFNGNQTRIGYESSYLNRFNLLPYYARSTNRAYFEGHAEHNFRGWILGKIPLINKLNYNLVAGAHLLSTDGNRLYREFSIGINNLGFGKYRFLRIDYVYSQGLSSNDGAFVFGLSF